VGPAAPRKTHPHPAAKIAPKRPPRIRLRRSACGAPWGEAVQTAAGGAVNTFQ